MTSESIVIGGHGFLGGAVVDCLSHEGRAVGIIDIRGTQELCDQRFGEGMVKHIRGSILDRRLLSKHLRGVKEVFHFAGALGTSELDGDPVAAVETNILGSLNVFNAAVAAEVPRVFHASKPNAWTNTYSITKEAAERFAAMYDGDVSTNTRFRSLRYFNAYGPRQSLAPVRKLLPTFAAQALAGQPLEVFGDGEQVVDLIYVRDAAEMTVGYMRAPDQRGGLVPDCGRGVPVTVNEVADAVNAAIGNDAGVVHLPMRRGEKSGTELVADPGPLLTVLPRFEFSNWEVSLQETLDWYAARTAATV
jgi:UDP-glucose 4-epimerase